MTQTPDAMHPTQRLDQIEAALHPLVAMHRRADSFDRSLSRSDEDLLLQHWAGLLGLSIHRGHLRYLQGRMAAVESLCAGRLAGTVQNAVLRALIVQSVPGPQLRLLEIGVLFGVNAAFLYDVAQAFFERTELLLIDPLDGYYGADRPDPATGLPITRRVVTRNLDLLGVPDECRTIHATPSADPATVKAASAQPSHVVFIDGDHGYDGVRTDFELYAPAVAPGGYLLFDNYNDASWPDVRRFVDELIQRPDERFEHVGSAWETAVFRRRGATGGEAA